jgi:hypothetical protein
MTSITPKLVPWVLTPSARQKALDNIRLVDSGVLCRSKFARLFNSVSVKTGECNEINCKSWRCVKHRKKWGYKWHHILSEHLKDVEITLLVNLTTAEFVDNEIIFKAMRRFFWAFRQHFGPTEYLRVTEYNKNHTQPHFHLLLVCPDLKFPPMPETFRKGGKNEKLSYPENVYRWIEQTWGDCLEYFAPDKKRTSVVWCQPPGNSVASARYAVNYITGKNAKDKNEEPDSTWLGRKLCYSKKFFNKPASKIWIEYLAATFGPPDPDDRFYWTPADGPRIEGESPLEFAHMKIMKQRYFEAKYYRDNGYWPVDPASSPAELESLWFDVLETGQETFTGLDPGRHQPLKPVEQIVTPN